MAPAVTHARPSRCVSVLRTTATEQQLLKQKSGLIRMDRESSQERHAGVRLHLTALMSHVSRVNLLQKTRTIKHAVERRVEQPRYPVIANERSEDIKPFIEFIEGVKTRWVTLAGERRLFQGQY